MLKKLKIIPTAGLKNVEKINRNRRCLCKMLQSMLFWCRLFGLAPIKWSHPNGNVFIKEDGRCHFEISKPWTWYSIGMILIYIALLCVTIDLNYITTSNANVLYILHECIYYVFSSLLTIFGVWNAKRLAQALNDMQPFLRSGLMCQSSKLTLQKHNFIAICIILIQLFLQYVALIYMIYNGKYITNVVQLKELISKIIQNVPFMFYYLFCTICAMYVTLLMCFETSLYQTLSNGLLRPSDADSLGIMRFTRCTGSHTSAVKRRFKDDTFVEDLNALRILHENIRQTIIQANEAFNPQIAIHISIELGVIIMHLYAFITYINDNIKSGELLTFHFLDMFFVCCHTIGFIIFLSSGHGLKWTQINLLQHISEIPSRNLNQQEFAELRFFIMKLTCAPLQLTAGCFFLIDVRLLAPITGYVVTYLLMALQFKIYSINPAELNETTIYYYETSIDTY